MPSNLRCKTCGEDLVRNELLSGGELVRDDEGNWSVDLSGFTCMCYSDEGVFQARTILRNGGVYQTTEDDAQDWEFLNSSI